jgi:hypothetical protein
MDKQTPDRFTSLETDAKNVTEILATILADLFREVSEASVVSRMGEQAKLEALWSLVSELAIHSGISERLVCGKRRFFFTRPFVAAADSAPGLKGRFAKLYDYNEHGDLPTGSPRPLLQD